MKASIFPFFGKLRLSGSEIVSPYSYLKHLAETQTALADAFYVESRFEQALGIFKRLAKTEPETFLSDVARICGSGTLSTLYYRQEEKKSLMVEA